MHAPANKSTGVLSENRLFYRVRAAASSLTIKATLLEKTWMGARLELHDTTFSTAVTVHVYPLP